MKQQLTLEHIAWYFTEGLMVEINCVDGLFYECITAIQRQDGTDIIHVSNTDFYPDSEDNDFSIKPILRPMYDLTKPFVKDGVETTHLQELARIEGFFTEGHKFELNDYNLHSLRQGRFKFMYINQSFNLWIDETPTIIENQIALFQYLAKHKFDFQNLIGLGLAIDVNTLENNVYN